MASRESIEKLGMAFGFCGPFGTNLKTYIDEDVLEMSNFVTGANVHDHHLVNVNLGDIRGDQKQVGDFRQAVEGDRGLLDGKEVELKFKTAIELGHIFKLNLRYSIPLKAVYLDSAGKENPMIMGCYGIGVNRILAAAIEQCSDEKGIVWPKNIAPFQVQVILVDAKDTQSQEIAGKLEVSELLRTKNVDLLVDDRPETAGVKFNDADLIGIPLRVILGPKNLKNGQAEIKVRKTGEISLVPVADLEAQILKILDKIA